MSVDYFVLEIFDNIQVSHSTTRTFSMTKARDMIFVDRCHVHGEEITDEGNIYRSGKGDLV